MKALYLILFTLPESLTSNPNSPQKDSGGRELPLSYECDQMQSNCLQMSYNLWPDDLIKEIEAQWEEEPAPTMEETEEPK